MLCSNYLLKQVAFLTDGGTLRPPHRSRIVHRFSLDHREHQSRRLEGRFRSRMSRPPVPVTCHIAACARNSQTQSCDSLVMRLPARTALHCPPRATAAQRFVLVAIELGFSFAVGVSCLVFSVNLVRKLREDDQPSYYLERDSSSGSAESTSIAGSASTRDGRVSSLPRENGASRLSSSKTRAHALAGASPEFGALSTADVARRRPSGRSRASLVARRRPQEDRGIGSLLTRKNRSSGSRLNVYDDSDEEEEETMTMTAGNRRSTRDRGMIATACVREVFCRV